MVAKPVEPAQPKLVGLALVGGEVVGVVLVGGAVLGGAGANDICCVLLLSVYILCVAELEARAGLLLHISLNESVIASCDWWWCSVAARKPL